MQNIIVSVMLRCGELSLVPVLFYPWFGTRSLLPVVWETRALHSGFPWFASFFVVYVKNQNKSVYSRRQESQLNQRTMGKSTHMGTNRLLLTPNLELFNISSRAMQVLTRSEHVYPEIWFGESCSPYRMDQTAGRPAKILICSCRLSLKETCCGFPELSCFLPETVVPRRNRPLRNAVPTCQSACWLKSGAEKIIHPVQFEGLFLNRALFRL